VPWLAGRRRSRLDATHYRDECDEFKGRSHRSRAMMGSRWVLRGSGFRRRPAASALVSRRAERSPCASFRAAVVTFCERRRLLGRDTLEYEGGGLELIGEPHELRVVGRDEPFGETTWRTKSEISAIPDGQVAWVKQDMR